MGPHLPCLRVGVIQQALTRRPWANRCANEEETNQALSCGCELVGQAGHHWGCGRGNTGLQRIRRKEEEVWHPGCAESSLLGLPEEDVYHSALAEGTACAKAGVMSTEL